VQRGLPDMSAFLVDQRRLLRDSTVACVGVPTDGFGAAKTG
jgi:hypothetical protein